MHLEPLGDPDVQLRMSHPDRVLKNKSQPEADLAKHPHLVFGWPNTEDDLESLNEQDTIPYLGYFHRCPGLSLNTRPVYRIWQCAGH